MINLNESRKMIEQYKLTLVQISMDKWYQLDAQRRNVSMRRGSVFFLNYIFVWSIRTHKYNLTEDYWKLLHKYRISMKTSFELGRITTSHWRSYLPKLSHEAGLVRSEDFILAKFTQFWILSKHFQVRETFFVWKRSGGFVLLSFHRKLDTNKKSTVSLFTQIFLIVAGNLISNNHGELFTFALLRFFLIGTIIFNYDPLTVIIFQIGNGSNPANKMLADCRQTGNRFDQKMSADWHQLRSHSASVLSTEPVHIIKQQIGSRNRTEPAAFIGI